MGMLLRVPDEQEPPRFNPVPEIPHMPPTPTALPEAGTQKSYE